MILNIRIRKALLCLAVISSLSVSILASSPTQCYGAEAEESNPSQARNSTFNGIHHVVVIVLENTPFEYAIKQPYLNALSKKGALLTHYSAVTHPSQPNYVAMISGSTEGVDGNAPVSLERQNLGDLLEAQGKGWKAYAEAYPGNCFLKPTQGPYARKHVPFLSFKNIQDNPDRCRRVVNASDFPKDVSTGKLPEFSLYIPDLNDDGHDTGVAFADSYVKGTFDSYFNNKKLLNHTLFILTFDEGIAENNTVYTLFYGAGIKPGFRSDLPYNHYSLLLTLEKVFGLPSLGKNDAHASLINDIWNHAFPSASH